VLRAEVVPAYGGDTTWANTVAAYEGLSPVLRAFVDGLRAEHRYGAAQARKGTTFGTGQVFDTKPLVARHPVVRVHPITGERALFVNPGFTSRIVGMRREESEAILALLFEHMTRPEYTVRFMWEPGSVAFWDNRATAHLGPQDIDHLDVQRVLHRVTLIGEVPVGVDGRESELVVGTPFRSAPVFGAQDLIREGGPTRFCVNIGRFRDRYLRRIESSRGGRSGAAGPDDADAAVEDDVAGGVDV
jgi:taurine dioxygenase